MVGVSGGLIVSGHVPPAALNAAAPVLALGLAGDYRLG